MKSLLFSIILLNAFSLNAQKLLFATSKIKQIVKNENIALLDSLIDNGMDINKQYRFNETILHYAAYEQKTSLVRYLIDKGASLDILNKNNWTPLEISIGPVFSNDSIAELLIHNGADVNLADRITPLQWSIFYNNEYIFELLLEYGADVNHTCDKCCDFSAFLMCCKYGTTKMLKTLLDENVDFKHRDCKNRNGLMYAIKFENVEVIRYLLKMEHDFNTTDARGRTISVYALKTKNEEIFKLVNKYTRNRQIDSQ